MKETSSLAPYQTNKGSFRLPLRWVSNTARFGAKLSSTGFALVPKQSNFSAKQSLFLDALISEEAMGIYE
tara:strand:+ start:134 stop:343 length:210 start_codon:yes stop_codon:yes gene_type:complete